jgi:ABC-type branched-subunit amino acid transport system permease subunit
MPTRPPPESIRAKPKSIIVPASVPVYARVVGGGGTVVGAAVGGAVVVVVPLEAA